LEFSQDGFDDFSWWVERDRSKALRIVKLLREVQRDPYQGIGKPEPLKYEFTGCWSRRIDDEHRLVYEVREDRIRVVACRYHY